MVLGTIQPSCKLGNVLGEAPCYEWEVCLYSNEASSGAMRGFLLATCF